MDEVTITLTAALRTWVPGLAESAAAGRAASANSSNDFSSCNNAINIHQATGYYTSRFCSKLSRFFASE